MPIKPRKARTITFSLPSEMADQGAAGGEGGGPHRERVLARGHPPVHRRTGVAADDPARKAERLRGSAGRGEEEDTQLKRQAERLRHVIPSMAKPERLPAVLPDQTGHGQTYHLRLGGRHRLAHPGRIGPPKTRGQATQLSRPFETWAQGRGTAP